MQLAMMYDDIRGLETYSYSELYSLLNKAVANLVFTVTITW